MPWCESCLVFSLGTSLYPHCISDSHKWSLYWTLCWGGVAIRITGMWKTSDAVTLKQCFCHASPLHCVAMWRPTIRNEGLHISFRVNTSQLKPMHAAMWPPPPAVIISPGFHSEQEHRMELVCSGRALLHPRRCWWLKNETCWGFSKLKHEALKLYSKRFFKRCHCQAKCCPKISLMAFHSSRSVLLWKSVII